VALLATPLPARREDLRIEPFGEAGEHVVKDPRSGDFFLVGVQEHFLLLQLDGRTDVDVVRDAFARRFHEPLAEQDLATFVETARDQGILAGDVPRPPPSRSLRNFLTRRVRIFNPDRLFAAVEPRLRFLWTRGFAVLSAATVVLAVLVMGVSGEELARSTHAALGWDTGVLCACVLFLLGMLHEASHGLTCKHYGGEVREIGFLLLFFVPCFYCNVSDAWLIREKRKRIAVMTAGVWCDLLVWAVAVLVWHVAEPDTLIHRLAFVLLTASGLETLLNLNPLIKLDGYYVLSDWAEVPNLRARSIERAKGHLRHWLWGAPPPGPESRSRFLSGFGLVSWAFSTLFLVWMVALLGGWLRGWIGVAGWAAAALLALPGMVDLFQGVIGGDIGVMLTKRRIRSTVWLVVLVGVAATVRLV
jgi:putative peptide zinc metalloprotease protein